MSRTFEQAKGAIFETVIKRLLHKNEYEPCRADGEQVDDRGRVRGRGEWHQIDALGRWKYTIPFVYPIRLLCEAKCWDHPVGLPVVRNFVGVLKDIVENYFVEDNQDIDKRMFSKRYADCGGIFSANGFTKPAQRYAYAQGIFLVSYENNPVITNIMTSIENVSRSVTLQSRRSSARARREFSEWFERRWNAPSMNDSGYVSNRREFLNHMRSLRETVFGIRTSVIGVATGVYPFHLLSYQEIPYDLFRESDEILFRATY